VDATADDARSDRAQVAQMRALLYRLSACPHRSHILATVGFVMSGSRYDASAPIYADRKLPITGQ